MKSNTNQSSSPVKKSTLDIHEAHQRKTLNTLLWAVGLAATVMLIVLISLDYISPNPPSYSGREGLYVKALVVLSGTIVIGLIARHVSYLAASLIFSAFILVTILFSDTPLGFIEGQTVAFLVFPVVIACSLLPPWGGYIVAAIIDISLAIASVIIHANVPNIPAMILIFIVALIIQQSTSSLKQAIEKEHKINHALTESEKVLASQNQTIQEVSRKLVEVEEQERRLLASELHDDLGQSLTSLKLNLELASSSRSTATRRQRMADSRELVSELMDKVRNLSLDLRPAMLDDFGLFPALRWLFDRFQSQMGISIHCNCDLGSKQRFEPHIETAAFRIIQEALTNIARHASVREARVTISTGNAISIEVTDSGTGFDAIKIIQNAAVSAGLSGMQERARLLGGHVEFQSKPGAGTRVLAEIPLGRNAQ